MTVSELENRIRAALPDLAEAEIRYRALSVVALEAGTGIVALNWKTKYMPGWINEQVKRWEVGGAINAGRISRQYVERIVPAQIINEFLMVEPSPEKQNSKLSVINKENEGEPMPVATQSEKKNHNARYKEKLIERAEQGEELTIPQVGIVGRAKYEAIRASLNGHAPQATVCELPKSPRTRKAIATLARKAAAAVAAEEDAPLPAQAVERNREAISAIAAHPAINPAAGDVPVRRVRVSVEVIEGDEQILVRGSSDRILRYAQTILNQIGADIG